MEIQVVKDVPSPGNRRRWMEVWEAVVAAEPQWVKVTADTEKAATDLRVAAQTHRTWKMEARLRGQDVYLRVVGRR